MRQAALWHIMKEAGIPDVDLLENLYSNSTVQLHEAGETGATVTFDTVTWLVRRVAPFVQHPDPAQHVLCSHALLWLLLC